MTEKNFLMVRLLEGAKATPITAPMLHQSGPAGRTLRGPGPQLEDHIWGSPVPLTLAGSANRYQDPIGLESLAEVAHCCS